MTSMFAEIIVKQRTDVQALTYAIPPSIIPYIHLGSVVTVPLRRKEVRGVVVKLMRHVSRELKPKIKDILTIDKNGQGFSSSQIETIEKLADYYAASLAEVAYHALAFPSFLSKSDTKTEQNKPLFLQAPWLDRQKFYLDIVKKYQEKKRLIFLFPTEYFAKEFAQKVKGKNVFYDETTSVQTKQIRHILETNETAILIGSQKWAFFPLRANDILVIDQPDHIGGISQRRPYLSTKQIGIIRSKTENISLVMGADIVSILDYPKRLNETWRFIEKKIPQKELLILDRRRSNELFLPSAIKELEQTKRKNEKILVFTASKNWSRVLYCRSCEQLVTCPNCGTPITLVTEIEFICPKCQLTGSVPNKCQNEHENLITLGEGVKRVKAVLTKILDNQTITEISSDTNLLPYGKVMIVTEKITSFPPQQRDLVFIASVDQFLLATRPNAVWHLLEILMSLRTAKKIVIQTNFPDHWIWSAFSTGKFASYYSQELQERHKYQLPPYGQELSVFGRESSLDKLQEQSKEIIEKIEENLKKISIVTQKSQKINVKEWELELTLYNPTHLSVEQKRLLRSFLPFSWFIRL